MFIPPLLRRSALLTAMALLSAPPVAAEVLGPDAAACAGGDPAAVLVHVSGFKNTVGTVRVQAYGATPGDFLKKGAWLRRVEVPLAGRRTVDVCLKLPAPGRYGIAVRHDANRSGKSDWNDGGGFSRNPRLSLLNLKPRFDQVAITVAGGHARTDIVMNYRRGLSIGPER